MKNVTMITKFFNLKKQNEDLKSKLERLKSQLDVNLAKEKSLESKMKETCSKLSKEEQSAIETIFPEIKAFFVK